jgi:four helix bundle protein
MSEKSKVYTVDLRGKCREFSLEVIKLLDTLPNKRAAWVIADQLMRSATSIGANLIEAKASSSRLEYKKFYEIALKSANETEYWLDLLSAAELAEPEVIDDLQVELKEITNMVASGVIKLKSR